MAKQVESPSRSEAESSSEQVADSRDFDLFLTHTAAESSAVEQLAAALQEHGIRTWTAEQQIGFGGRWKADVLSELSRVPAAALVVGSSGLPNEWGRREIEQAAKRKSSDPGFRFLLVYLPEADPIPGAALPLTPDAVVSLSRGGEAEGIAQLAASLRAAAPDTTAPPRLSASVETATQLSGAVPSFTIVRRLLESHPEYAGGSASPTQLGEPPASAPKRPVAQWLAEVEDLYEPGRVPQLHGRLLIDGLARVDSALDQRLRDLGVLEPLRREITPAPDELLRKRRDGVATLTDHPTKVDELGRAVLAKALSSRIRRVRLDELERHRNDRDPSLRRGGPLLLHLYGRWGAGKTSLLYFLREQLEETVWGTKGRDDRRNFLEALREAIRRRKSPDELGGDPMQRWIVIDFNGWQHQRIVPPWWWLMSAVARDGGAALRRIDRPRWWRLKAWDYKWRLRGAIPGLLLIGAGLVIAWFVWKSGKISHRGGIWPSTLSATEGVAKSFSAILALALTVWGGVRALNRWLLVDSPRTAGTVLRHGNDPLDALSERFSGLIRRLHYPVAIFIDDLDRCQPKYVVELLEGVQTLFRDVPVTYIVAADRDWICQSFAEEYDSFCGTVGEPGRPLGHLFLEKFFQVSAPVPRLSDEMKRSYLQRLLSTTDSNGEATLEIARREAHKRFQALTSREEIDAELSDGTQSVVEQQAAAEAAVLRLTEPELEAETEHMLQPFAPLLEPNPRAMKRLVNAYGISSGIEILRSVATASNGPAPNTLALWTILSLRWPLLGDYLAEKPTTADAILANQTVPQDAPEWLKALWHSQDVRDVLEGNAPQVNARLDGAAVAASVGRTIPHASTTG